MYNSKKYFLDTEFIEGFRRPLLDKKKHFIDIISIGLVCEDGRQYYAVSNEFNPALANEFVKEHVLPHLPDKKTITTGYLKPKLMCSRPIWQSNEEIKNNLLDFFECWRDQLFYRAPEGIEIYGYYSDYDWVAFASLFGQMIDLPHGFPMYCRDLKQMLDERISPEEIKAIGYEAAVNRLKNREDYPKQSNEHHALADAKWNQELYNFLKDLAPQRPTFSR